ncbi:hypothetical protein [Nissabacter sp. SGAir0207]|uniref:hypothetical protein n=1 Tax=Nissabacter sp. SGAir0207 TaxID=2126321 RepID=UPI0010CD4635|nr:hypothetical protein [Nissabacter sp. SGAir0207]QCR38138.1 hypothetical protein C1N62_18595 [Nissabacter sp. SGAir0207]
MNNDDNVNNMHKLLGEAVMSLLEDQGAVNNHTILERLTQLAEGESDEDVIMAYWQARKAFRQSASSAAARQALDDGFADTNMVRLHSHRVRLKQSSGEKE